MRQRGEFLCLLHRHHWCSRVPRWQNTTVVFMAKMAESKEVGCQCWEAQNWEQYVYDLNDVFFSFRTSHDSKKIDVKPYRRPCVVRWFLEGPFACFTRIFQCKLPLFKKNLVGENGPKKHLQKIATRHDSDGKWGNGINGDMLTCTPSTLGPHNDVGVWVEICEASGFLHIC